MNQRISKMRKKLKKYLDQDRYEHTLGVMYTAASLAMRYGYDMDEAMIVQNVFLLRRRSSYVPNIT